METTLKKKTETTLKTETLKETLKERCFEKKL